VRPAVVVAHVGIVPANTHPIDVIDVGNPIHVIDRVHAVDVVERVASIERTDVVDPIGIAKPRRDCARRGHRWCAIVRTARVSTVISSKTSAAEAAATIAAAREATSSKSAAAEAATTTVKATAATTVATAVKGVDGDGEIYGEQCREKHTRGQSHLERLHLVVFAGSITDRMTHFVPS
jgi:hypothetical protein